MLYGLHATSCRRICICAALLTLLMADMPLLHGRLQKDLEKAFQLDQRSKGQKIDEPKKKR